MSFRRPAQGIFIAVAALVIITGTAHAQSTAFTYQGHLMDAGASANGNYDIQFTLKTALTAGTTVGTPQAVSPVVAVNGIFTVTLDFGSGSFDGSDRWVDLGVRPFGSAAAYTVLAPRQRLTATPYALRALSATSFTGNISPAQIPTGTITGAMIAPGAAISASTLDASSTIHVGSYAANGTPKLIEFGDPGYVSIGENTLDDQMELKAGKFIFLNGSIYGNGSGLTNLPASALTGTITSAQLASGLTLGGTTTGTFVGNGAGLTGVTVATAPPGMVLIPAGAFTMGNSVVADTDITDATPISTTVSAFYMDVNEVSLSQWQSVYYWATSNGYAFAAGAGKGPNHPVHTVSWYDVVKWCNARSEQAGKTPVYYTDDAQTTVYRTGNVSVTNAQAKWTANGYRLPTEAEWEKAARGGLAGQRFPWGNTITQNLANYYGGLGGYNGSPAGYHPDFDNVPTPYTSPVGSFALNGYGLNDMAGNVFEWCWDWYGTPYAGGADPHGAATGSNRVLRGGSWLYDAFIGGRCADRDDLDPTGAGNDFGFRSVLPPGQP